MPSYRSIISIVTASARADANATLDATGHFGPETYRAGLSPDGSWPPTHYVCNHGSTTDEEHQMWAGLLNGDLPALPPGAIWGEEGIISAADAIAAFTNGNVILDCITHTDIEFDSDAHFQAIRSSLGLLNSNPPE